MRIIIVGLVAASLTASGVATALAVDGAGTDLDRFRSGRLGAIGERMALWEAFWDWFVTL
jgi:hypothetical protein